MAAPVAKLKHKTIDVAVFETEVQGMTRKMYTAVVNRAYLNKKTNTWEKQTISLTSDQILDMAQLLEHTWWEINKLQETKGTTDENKFQPKDDQDVPY